ncbi:hypothetical protein AMTRI_Chr03g46790 [Amborella trichopoda]
MDRFVHGWPSKLKRKTTIFVVVDRLSKAAHFIPISHPYTSTSVAQIFFNHIFKLYGMPKSIVSTKKTPYEVVYGRAPPTLLFYIPGTTQVESIDRELQDRDRVLKREQLQLSQNRMKKAYDVHHTKKRFNIGDLVYLRLQPYRQVSAAHRKNLNLSPRYYGPFELPSGSKIHPVFHVSCLKEKIGTMTLVQEDLPIVQEEGDHMVSQPQAILDRRVGKHQEEVLVH